MNNSAFVIYRYLIHQLHYVPICIFRRQEYIKRLSSQIWIRR